ncbi:SGNH/GDSL hydrolase family protein [Ottowia testudinis]|uniref:SGNH/GDSL hydrolase family protein n=2 Tax=Ottowia testudinis TaxID=2816950 RepID=A0A975H7M3_9BURK|nr:SGNH/GDSL hydrolase family protein [Ottowia testudinis]QTD47207.1 SGNH/GDSL hydrolase family protein [Ottowia testudinis]
MAMAVALSACGGSGDGDSNPLGLDTMKVVGDSLSDSGTFADVPGGARTFTVQGTADEPNVVWVERVALAYRVAPLCPVYKFNGSAFTPNTKPNCTNYAVGGARINNPAASGGAAAPLSVANQLQDAAAKGWGAKDLVLVDGGGNDAADLVGAYLGASADQGAAYQALLGTLVPAGSLQAVLAGANGPENAGGLYMQALADSLAGSIKAEALGKGAKQVVVANMPAITYTPRFQAVLDQVGAKAGANGRAQAEALFKGWVNAFNARLASQFSGESRVKVVDVAARFTDQATNPSRYGLTNVTLPVCGAQGVTAVPQRSFAQCTASALSGTTPPPGAPAGAGWWQRYLFSDGFHPTPYGHQLFADQVFDVLEQAGWL